MRKYMHQKVDLETGIFRILSENRGPSQSELLDELKEYSERLKESNLVHHNESLKSYKMSRI